ncbi:MAG TPA: hypothetical protein VFU47_13190 [Armatimonadota bacterium]|nr:hypothetical protein [Armatimonadota bacterium]
MSFFRKLFGRAQPQEAPAAVRGDDPADANPVATAAFLDRLDDGPKGTARATGEGTAGEEFEEFRATFCHQPGVNFWAYLEADNAWKMQQWLQPDTPEAEPKAIIRLLLEMQRRGENLWDQAGLAMFLHGRWSQGGGPCELSA